MAAHEMRTHQLVLSDTTHIRHPNCQTKPQRDAQANLRPKRQLLAVAIVVAEGTGELLSVTRKVVFRDGDLTLAVGHVSGVPFHILYVTGCGAAVVWRCACLTSHGSSCEKLKKQQPRNTSSPLYFT